MSKRFSQEYLSYIASEAWSLKRLKVLQRDNFSCQTCGSNHDLQCHHKSYTNLFHEPLSDLITLCSHCHNAIHRSLKARKSAQKRNKLPDSLKQKQKRLRTTRKKTRKTHKTTTK